MAIYQQCETGISIYHKINYIQQMLKHNGQCTGVEYMEETLTNHAIQGWYNIDSTQVLNLLSAANKETK
jgi:hypothetical protein